MLFCWQGHLIVVNVSVAAYIIATQNMAVIQINVLLRKSPFPQASHFLRGALGEHSNQEKSSFFPWASAEGLLYALQSVTGYQIPSLSPGYSQATFQERSGEQGCSTWPGTGVVGSSDPIVLESYSFLYLFWLGNVKDAQQQYCLGGGRGSQIHLLPPLFEDPPRVPLHGFCSPQRPSEESETAGIWRGDGWVFLWLFLFQWKVWLLRDDNMR